MNNIFTFIKKNAPIVVAGGAALIALIYYIWSGHSNLDANIKQLEQSGNVEKTVSTDNNTLVVKCKNGDMYQIYFKPGQASFQGLIYDKCGPEGTQASN